MTNDLERYLAAVKRFNELVSELAGKLEQIGDARDEALKASADLQRELEATDQKVRDIASAVRQQVTAEFTKKTARPEDVADRLTSRRVS